MPPCDCDADPLAILLRAPWWIGLFLGSQVLLMYEAQIGQETSSAAWAFLYIFSLRRGAVSACVWGAGRCPTDVDRVVLRLDAGPREGRGRTISVTNLDHMVHYGLTVPSRRARKLHQPRRQQKGPNRENDRPYPPDLH